MADNKTINTKYLIIGNSAGAIGAVEAIRDSDKLGVLTIVSDEPYPAYSRPYISPLLAKERPLEQINYRPADFYEKHNVQALLGVRADKLDTNGKTAVLSDGRTIKWEKLLLAVGSRPFVPNDIKGLNLKGVFTFSKMDDAKAIDTFLAALPQGAVKAVVNGAGLVSVSSTEALLKRGVKVTMIVRSRLLRNILDEEACALEEAAMRHEGVELINGHTITSVNGNASGSVESVTLNDGRTLPCAMVLMATGVEPRTELAKGTNIKVNQGIVVDRYMATTAPDVYACGDAAEAHDYIYDKVRLTPIWPNAFAGGKIAGYNMAGVKKEYPGSTTMNALHYFGLDMIIAGMTNPADASYKVFTHKNERKHSYKKVVVKDGKVVGMIFAVDIENAGIIQNLMKDRVDITGREESLVADNFGLLSLADDRWKPRMQLPDDRLAAIQAAARGK